MGGVAAHAADLSGSAIPDVLAIGPGVLLRKIRLTSASSPLRACSRRLERLHSDVRARPSHLLSSSAAAAVLFGTPSFR
jgi:hypothetical protein